MLWQCMVINYFLYLFHYRLYAPFESNHRNSLVVACVVWLKHCLIWWTSLIYRLKGTISAIIYFRLGCVISLNGSGSLGGICSNLSQTFSKMILFFFLCFDTTFFLRSSVLYWTKLHWIHTKKWDDERKFLLFSLFLMQFFRVWVVSLNSEVQPRCSTG